MSRTKLMALWRCEINRRTCVCYLCGKLILKQEDLSADHVFPKSKGGLTTDSNLKPTHKKCNSEKSDMLLEEYILKKKQK